MRFSAFFVFLSLFVWGLRDANAQYYNIGNPTYQEIWVNPVSGSDSNSGNTRGAALRTINAAWQRIPQGTPLTNAYKILLTPGSYPESSIPNYWEDRHGTQSNPILIQASDGQGTAILEGDINAFDVDYLYLVDFSIIPAPAGDAFHCEQCDHLLIRGMTMSGGNRDAQETIKINQSQYIYIEDSDISGAYDNSIDFVGVQYGHIARNKIHDAGDWCAYVKGGSAQILVQANKIYDCGTGGFTAGQGTGFEFMTSPWLHYEAYDIKFINNLVYRTNGAGFGVNGGYNILLAHNTLYKVGRNSHAIEVVYGYRSCDGNSAQCGSYLTAGGWGTSLTGIEGEPIPNKNVFIYNNIVYNPPGFESQYSQFAIYGPRTPAPGSNIPSPSRTDVNVQIKGNYIWNAAPSLGIEDTDQGCQPSNPTCNATQLVSDNYINLAQPSFINAEAADFRLATSITSLPVSISAFAGGDRASPPLAPVGNLNNTVEIDYANSLRSIQNSVGAYASIPSEADAYLPWNSFLGMINIVELVNKSSGPVSVNLTVVDTTGLATSQIRVNLPANAQNDIILNDLSGFRINSYGLVALDTTSDDVEARLSVYKLSREANNFDYAYSSSTLEPVTGTSSISFNTMQPSQNINDSGLSVANWLSITNPDPTTAHAFTVYRYSESGVLLTTKRVNVSPFGRVDIEGGHEIPGQQRVGLNKIVPDSLTSEYFANIVRYGLDHGVRRDFQFAYPIISAAGVAGEQYVAISNGGNAQNWLEIVNVSSVANDVTIQAYNSSGQAIGAPSSYRIGPNSQYHYYATQNLAAGASGLLKVTSTNAAVIHSLFYFYATDRTINSMYGLRALTLNPGSGSYNLFLQMFNWLKIANLSDSEKTGNVRVYNGSTLLTQHSYNIPARGTIELPLHDRVLFNTTSNTYGQVEVSGAGLASHILRIRPASSEIDFVFPTEVK